MPIDSRSALAFGPSFVFSGMLSRVANRLSHTFFVICMTSRLFGTPRMFHYGKSQKTDLVFHTFNSGSGAFRLELIFPGGGHFFQFFNIMSISVPLLLRGAFRSSAVPSNRSLRFLHGSLSGSHLRCPMNTVFEDPGSLGSWGYVVSSMYLAHPQCP